MLRWTENIIFQVTKDCNMRCKYCFQGQTKEKKIISLEDYKKVLDTVIYYRCVLSGNHKATINMHFHGGEYTLLGNSFIKDAINYTLKRKKYFTGISIISQTNGLLFDDELASFYAEKKIPIGLSFDGIDSLRSTTAVNKGILDKFSRFIKEYNLNVGVLGVFSKKNMKDWISLEKELYTRNFNSFGLLPVAVLPNDESLNPTTEDVIDYWAKPELERIASESEGLFERTLMCMCEKYLQRKLFYMDPVQLKTGCFDKYCGTGINMISIDPHLDVFNCDKWMEEGDFTEYRFKTSIDTLDFLGMQQLKRLLNIRKGIDISSEIAECSTCNMNNICLGTCPEQSMSTIGEMRQLPLYCNFYKYIGDFLDKNWFDILKNHKWKLLGRVFELKEDTKKFLESSGYSLVVDIEQGDFYIKEVRKNELQ